MLKTAELAEAGSESGWQAAFHGAMLTFSPIALSLLTLHAPPCCSDLIGLELTVRPGGQDDCVSAHGAHLNLLAPCSLTIVSQPVCCSATFVPSHSAVQKKKKKPPPTSKVPNICRRRFRLVNVHE